MSVCIMYTHSQQLKHQVIPGDQRVSLIRISFTFIYALPKIVYNSKHDTIINQSQKKKKIVFSFPVQIILIVHVHDFFFSYNYNLTCYTLIVSKV
jgi:hypothetical protein